MLLISKTDPARSHFSRVGDGTENSELALLQGYRQGFAPGLRFYAINRASNDPTTHKKVPVPHGIEKRCS